MYRWIERIMISIITIMLLISSVSFLNSCSNPNPVYNSTIVGD